jgi:hypothetical protein
MDKPQLARYYAGERGAAFLLANDTELSTNTQYGPLKASYNGTIAHIIAVKQKQYEQTGFLTVEKYKRRDFLVAIMFKFSQLGCVQAHNLSKDDLAVSLDKPFMYFAHTSDDDLIGRSKDIVSIISNNAVVLTEITPADIADMDKAIVDFNTYISLSEIEIKEKKAEGTDPIPGLLDELDVHKYYLGKLLRSAFPLLYHTWATETKVGRMPGIRKTSLVVFFTEQVTGVALSRIKTTIFDGVNTFVKYSSRKGYARFYSLMPNNYDLIAEYPSFNPYNRSGIKVDEQHVERLNVILAKKTA